MKFMRFFLDKENLHKIPNFYNHHKLYDDLASKLAERIKITSPTCIIVDKSKFKKKISTTLIMYFHQDWLIVIIIL